MADISLFRARLLTLACSWATLVAGVAEPQAIYVGVEGGSNVATFAGRDVGYASSRTGLAFGASARIPVTPALAFRPGILYSQQGAQWAVSGGVLGVRINYLEVPLLANLTLPVDENVVIPSFYAGPVFDLRVGCSVSAASAGLSASLACDDLQVGLKTKSSAVGLALGTELGVPAGSGRVTFNARYTLGLNTIDNGGLNLDVKNRAWTLLAGYAFGLGRGAPSPSIAAPGDGGGIPALAVGVSVFDFNERASTGALLKATVWERSFLDMAAIGHRWPTLGGGSGWAGGLEAGYYPVGRGVIVARVALGVGYIRALPPPGYIGEISGVTTSLGLGARAQIAHLQLGAEALIRDDAGLHGDAELRFLGGYAPALRPDSVHGSAGVFLLAMVPLHGPWRFTEPGYEARLTTRLSERYAGSLSLALLHWRIPSSTYARGYLWDTRAVLVEPGWPWSRGGSGRSEHATASPTPLVMLEGPGDCLGAGAYARVTVTPLARALPLRGVGGLGLC